MFVGVIFPETQNAPFILRIQDYVINLQAVFQQLKIKINLVVRVVIGSKQVLYEILHRN